jgi:hypothetical protein
MQIGIAVTYFETEAFVPGAADLDEKGRQIAENKTKHLTVDQVLGWIDNEHLETVSILHWLRNLCEFVPELANYKSHVSILFLARVEHQLPICAITGPSIGDKRE